VIHPATLDFFYLVECHRNIFQENCLVAKHLSVANSNYQTNVILDEILH